MDRSSQEQHGAIVSALLTTFNHEAYIGEALDSLLSQTRALDEVLVVDDGSSDTTPEIVSTYSRFGVTLLRTSNRGPSYAMNTLLRRARGSVFLLQSGDDVSLPSRVVEQIQQLMYCDVASCTPKIINEFGIEMPTEAFPIFSADTSHLNGLDLFSRLFFSGNFICAPTVAMRRQVLEKTGFFHEGLVQLQDHHYWLRAAARGFRFATSTSAYASYRVHPQSLSRPENDHRTLNELPYVLRTALSALDHEQLLALLYGENSRSAQQPSVTSLRALVLLRHDRAEIRRLGLELLIDEIGDETRRRRLVDCFGLQPSAVFGLMSSA